jgi:molybdate/tungstate transport system ATP-binding protein
VIQVEALSITLGSFVLRNVNLSVERGEYVVIMGPTGSGKTVFLECLLGLHQPQCGSIRVDGGCMDSEPPERRNLAYVPQDYCLFPHMTLRQNIAYGMRLRHFAADRQVERVRTLSERLGITHLLGRRPLHLSGGERQRGALARALAIDPSVLLLDEPMSAVDEHTRDSLCDLLKGLQKELGVTVLHVCHSLPEALSLADRIAIFGRGTILQQDRPSTVVNRPADSFVARCVGSANIISGCGLADVTGRWFESDGWKVRSGHVPEGPCFLTVRPERVRVLSAPLATPGFCTPAVVQRRRDLGAVTLLDLRVGGQWLRAAVPSTAFMPEYGDLTPGSAVHIELPEDGVHFVRR